MAPHRNEKVEEILSTIQDEAQQIDEISQVRGWFSLKDSSGYYPTILSYAQEKTSMEETIQTITKPAEIEWSCLWISVIHAAKRDSNSHARLVDLVAAMKQHPGAASLPEFGMQARESFNDSPGSGAGYTDPEISAWTNLNYFYALLEASDIYKFPYYPIWVLRAALEDQPDDEPTVSGARKCDANIPAAAAWVRVLVKKLYEREQDLTPTNPNAGDPARGGELWTGGSEYSKKRWALWKKRFGEVAEIEGLKEETKKIAKETVEIMDKAEK